MGASVVGHTIQGSSIAGSIVGHTGQNTPSDKHSLARQVVEAARESSIGGYIEVSTEQGSQVGMS